MKAETLSKINEALARLEEGAYGYCFECGQEISQQRLRALPFAVRCKDCEEARENLAAPRAPPGAAAAVVLAVLRHVELTGEPLPRGPRRGRGPSSVRHPDPTERRGPTGPRRNTRIVDERSRRTLNLDEPAEEQLAIPPELPMLPLRDTVLFPNSFMPLAVARESSVRLIDDAIAGGKLIGVFTQRDAARRGAAPGGSVPDRHGDAHPQDVQAARRQPPPDRAGAGAPAARQRGRRTARTCAAASAPAVEIVRDEDRLEIDALQRNIKTNFQQVVSLSPLLSDDLQTLAMNITEPGKLADFIASSLTTITTPVKQELLETLDVRARMDDLNRILIKELEVLELGSKIQSQVQSEVGKNQREYFLREQMKAIQKELGEGDEQTKEIEELREKIEAAGMPEAVKKEALRELDRLSKMPAAAAEYTVVAHLPRLAGRAAVERSAPRKSSTSSAPRRCSTPITPDLEKAKDRILEYLAVRKLNPDVKGPILCFVGPPGVGKTSLAKSIADRARPQVRARVARRHARRGGDPRAPAHLHRRAAGPGHPGAAPRRVEEPGVHPRRDRQARLRLPRRPGVGAPRGARPRAEQHVPRPLPRRAVRPVRGALHHDGQRARPDPARAARPHGGARASRLHRGGEAEDRRASTSSPSR